MMRGVRGAALAMAVLAAVSCASDDDSSTEGPPSEQTTDSERASTGASHNDADVRFVARMIPRTDDAVAMAELADGRASAPEVLQLAARIKTARLAEADAMRGWLERWEPDETNTPVNGGTEVDAGSGLARLQATSDVDFDRIFLELMVELGTADVDMAEEELDAGSSAVTLELARDVIEARGAEIEEMQGLLSASSETGASAP